MSLLVFAVGVPQKHKLRLLMLSTTLFAFTLGGTAIALQFVDSSITSLIIELEVPFSFLLGALILKEKTTNMQWMGMALAFVGIYFIFDSPEVHSDNFSSIALLLLVSLSYAIAAIQVKYIDLSPFTITTWSSLFAMPQCFLVSLFLEESPLQRVAEASLSTWLLILAAAMTGVVALHFWNLLLKIYPLNQVVPFVMLIPVVALISSYFILGETTHYLALIGGAITLCGVAFQVIFTSKPPSSESAS